MKQDVQSHIKLPEKSDQVLFCSLTDHQVEVYQSYLNSDSVHSILSGRLKVSFSARVLYRYYSSKLFFVLQFAVTQSKMRKISLV